MTIAGLAAALRGMPRSARLLIDTPEGLKNLRWVSPAHSAARSTEAAASTAGEYAIVLQVTIEDCDDPVMKAGVAAMRPGQHPLKGTGGRRSVVAASVRYEPAHAGRRRRQRPRCNGRLMPRPECPQWVDCGLRE
jgi:hypothetical protein